MASNQERPTGLTRDAGYQIGVRRTLPVPLATAWQFLTSDRGVALWLGQTDSLQFEPRSQYRLADGTQGEVRIFAPDSHLRLTWQPPGWRRPATIQLRVIPNGARTVIAFHQEHLPDAATRAARRAFYQAVLAELAAMWAAGATQTRS